MRSKEARAEPWGFGKRAASAATLAACILVALPAQAQVLGESLSSSEIAYAVSDAGYRMTGQPRRSGHYYVAEGIGTDGRRVRVLIDANSGAVVGVKAAPRQEAQPQGFSALFAPEPRLVPPRNVPNVPGVQQPGLRPFSQQPADRPSSQQPGQAALQQSTGQPSFQQPAGQSLFQQPGDQPSFQEPAKPPTLEKREANVRRDGDGVRPAVRTVPEQQRPVQQKALRKPVREKPADSPAADRATGTAALQDAREPPAKPATRSRAAEKSTASINVPDKKAVDAGGMVAPVLLDDVKPNRPKEPPPMPQVAPLE
jgi:hypothetical protein